MLRAGHRHAFGHVDALFPRLIVVKGARFVGVQAQQGQLIQGDLQGPLVIQGLHPASTAAPSTAAAAIPLHVRKKRAGHSPGGGCVGLHPLLSPPALGLVVGRAGGGGAREKARHKGRSEGRWPAKQSSSNSRAGNGGESDFETPGGRSFMLGNSKGGKKTPSKIHPLPVPKKPEKFKCSFRVPFKKLSSLQCNPIYMMLS